MISILSIYTNHVSALDYSSNIGVGFTFNPTLSISLSSADLVISNLTPGTTADSNDITISVSTNNVYGYNLYATVGNEVYDNTNLTNASNSSDSNNNNNNTTSYAFSSISTNANLPNLDADNTWGYSYSLDNGSSWSNYNGLPLYTSNSPTRLKRTTEPSSDIINFKITAKASSTQPSGIYSNVVNFIAITKPSLITLADAYAAEGKELYRGYYKMQDMTSTICEEVEDIGAQLQVIDIRDDKVYWIAKLADGNCWMTQNLDLDIDETKIYTHNDTDLGWTINDETATWQPAEGHSTINFIGNTVDGWVDSNTEPYSANPGDIYYYTSGTEDNDIKYSSLQECISVGHNDCTHYHAGNYYNWSAAIASNDTSELTIQYDNSPDSICPKNWGLPKRNQVTKKLDYAILVDAYRADVISIRNGPLYFVRSGVVRGSITGGTLDGFYYHGTIYNDVESYFMSFSGTFIRPNEFGGSYYARRFNGYPVRCLAK